MTMNEYQTDERLKQILKGSIEAHAPQGFTDRVMESVMAEAALTARTRVILPRHVLLYSLAAILTVTLVVISWDTLSEWLGLSGLLEAYHFDTQGLLSGMLSGFSWLTDLFRSTGVVFFLLSIGLYVAIDQLLIRYRLKQLQSTNMYL